MIARTGSSKPIGGRPEAYFDPNARSAISTFAHIADVDVGSANLRRDLDNGTWAGRNAELLTKHELDLGYRLVIGEGS